MRTLFLFSLTVILLQGIQAFGTTPMEYFNSLVAGGDEPGYRDGAFVSARFNNPAGLCFDESGKTLYVADSGNHRIRVVNLDNSNEVGTLAGRGAAGKEDGSFDKATFNSPTRIVSLPNNRLADYDAGTTLIRLLDLKTRLVSSVPVPANIWDMLYRPQDDSLYFSEPESKSLGKLDLKSLAISTVFTNDPQLPSPQALCLGNDKFYAADRDSSAVFELSLPDAKTPDQKVVTFKQIGQADHIQGMAYSDGVLYAIQAGAYPFVQVDLPKSKPVSLATAWGFMVDNGNPGAEPLLDFKAGQPVGFSAPPQEPLKFFVSRPGIDKHSIVSLKDYHFDKLWKADNRSDSDSFGHVMDYDYPLEKPRGTYRIFLVGDSRTYIAPEVTPGSSYGDDWFYGAPRNYTIGKRLELFLNTEAALRGVKTHFEVLEWNRKGMALSNYAYYELPPVVKRYNIDLVLALEGHPGYDDYYMKPMTSEGIPSQKEDFEYILKPLSQRVPPGVAADLYQRYKKKVTTDTEKFGYPSPNSDTDFICGADPEMRKDLIEMSGRRLQMLSEKLQSMKTPEGYLPKLVLFHVPQRGWDNDCIVSYWRDLCEKYSLPLIDLTKSYNALKIAYYPAATDCCSGHFTAYGSKLVGYLLSRYLIEDQLIPFETADK